MRAFAIVVAATALSSARDAHAYRPFDGTDADVAELGEFELELGPVGYLRASRTSSIVVPNVVLNFGVFERWELVIQGTGELPLAGGDATYGDGGIFLKHLLREGTLQKKSGLSLATEFGVLLPEFAGSESGGVPVAGLPGVWSDAGVYLGFIASYAWRDLVVHWNASLARSVDRQNDFFAGAIFEFAPHARIRPVTELYVDFHGPTVTPSALVGFILRANDRLAFDAATRIAETNSIPVYEIRAGLTWTLAL